MNEKIQAQKLSAEDNDLSNAIRDATFELMARHENGGEHMGEPCGMNRVGHVAWIAHCLGIGSEHLQKLMACIAMYESGCPCGVPTLPSDAFKGHG